MKDSHALLHLHDQKSCPRDIFYPHDVQLLRQHACLNMSVVMMCRDNSTNLMLHPHPKFVHFSEILKYKFYSICYSIRIPAVVKLGITASSSIWNWSSFKIIVTATWQGRHTSHKVNQKRTAEIKRWTIKTNVKKKGGSIILKTPWVDIMH